MLTLSRLSVYPVKSMRGTALSQSLVKPEGLIRDRHFMLADKSGKFITARKYPEMVLFSPVISSEGIYLQAPDNDTILARFADFQTDLQPTEVWGNPFTAKVAPDRVNQWLSRFFPHPVQLRWISEQPQRRVNKWPDVPLSFADGYPFLLLNEASFHDLQNRCPAGIRAEQFRANIWIAGALPWEEDQWSVIQIGRVTFDVTKPCSRCVFTTINPENGRKHPTGEPMQTLASFRQAADDSHNVDFGLNLLARNTGVIRQGDKVSILQTPPARPYQSKPADHRRETGETPSAAPVTIQYADQVFSGKSSAGAAGTT